MLYQVYSLKLELWKMRLKAVVKVAQRLRQLRQISKSVSPVFVLPLQLRPLDPA